MTNKNVQQFYDKYFDIPFFSFETNFQNKEEFAYNYLIDNGIHKLYKFVAFGKSVDEDKIKLKSIKDQSLWFSYYKMFEDQTEFETKCNLIELSKKSNYDIQKMAFQIECQRQLMDVCCLTYEMNDKMWNEYANNCQGCCLELEIIDARMLLPIFYCDKDSIDFTDSLIKANIIITHEKDMLKKLNSRCFHELALFPYFIKDEKTYSWEKEIRLFCGDAFDNTNDFLGGKVYPFKKEQLGYKGVGYTYSHCGLKLKQIGRAHV